MKNERELSSIGEKFGLPSREFRLRVPNNYNHDTRLNLFRRKFKRKWFSGFITFKHINIYGHITDTNFSKVTDKLVPGKVYIIKLIPVLRLSYDYKLSSDECLNYLKSIDSLLVGAQGLSLLYEFFYEYLPKERKIVSFDEKSLLYVDERGSSNLPFIKIPGTSDDVGVYRGFESMDYEPLRGLGILDDGDCLLCFFED